MTRDSPQREGARTKSTRASFRRLPIPSPVAFDTSQSSPVRKVNSMNRLLVKYSRFTVTFNGRLRVVHRNASSEWVQLQAPTRLDHFQPIERIAALLKRCVVIFRALSRVYSAAIDETREVKTCPSRTSTVGRGQGMDSPVPISAIAVMLHYSLSNIQDQQ